MVKLLYFAWVREQVGKAEETVELPVELETISDVIDWLQTRGPEYQQAFAHAKVIRAALDQTHARGSACC